MQRKIVITALGKDRPGIVAEVSRILFETGCNIEDSSMTLLQGEFAMILIVSIPEDKNLKELVDRFSGVENSMGLKITMEELKADEMVRTGLPESTPYIISVLGADKPGIVFRVTKMIASYMVNITDLNTRVISKGESPVYAMVLEVEVPKDVNVKILQGELLKLGKELKVDITLKPIEPLKL